MAFHKLLCIFLVLGSLHVAVAQQCPPEGVSFLPHPDCTKYFVCDNGEATAMNCPEDLYYNPELEYCDFPVNVPECVGGTRPPGGNNGTTQYPSTSSDTSTTGVPSTTKDPVPILTRCGETINAPFGEIIYKLDEPYDANELCAFIIRVADHSSIAFQLHPNHGINATDESNAITIVSFNILNLVVQDTLGPPGDLNAIEVEGALAVVVFKTNKNTGTGFHLSFQGRGGTFFSKGEEVVLNSLEGGDYILPNEQNVWFSPLNVVVVTAGDKLVTDEGTALQLSISEDNLYPCEASCNCDVLHVSSFATDTVEREEIFCSIDYQRRHFETKGAFILLHRKFSQSDWYGSAKLTWNVGSNVTARTPAK